MVQNRQTTVAVKTNLNANHKEWLTIAVPVTATDFHKAGFVFSLLCAKDPKL